MAEYVQVNVGEQSGALLIPQPFEVNALIESVGWPARDPAAWQDAMHGSECVAFSRNPEDDTLNGLARLVGDGVMYAGIYDVVVRPEAQGRGLGSELVRTLLEKVGNRERVSVGLLVGSANVKPLQRFYEGLGFLRR